MKEFKVYRIIRKKTANRIVENTSTVRNESKDLRDFCFDKKKEGRMKTSRKTVAGNQPEKSFFFFFVF